MTDKKTTSNASQRKAKERDNKRKQGLVRLEIWIKPEWKAAIKKFIDELSGNNNGN